MLFGVVGIVIILVGTCLGIYWLHHSSTTTTSDSDHVMTVLGTVFINGTTSVASTDDDFICVTLDWWPPDKCDYGTCSWGKTTLLTLDLNNTVLSNAVKAFAPLKIRMGGTLQDKVVYDTQGDHQTLCTVFTKNSSNFLGFSNGCLTMSRWDELNTFFKHTGAVVTFGLNALYGRTIGSDGSVLEDWNYSNAESLIRYTIKHGYSVHGWELGNELSGNGIGARVSAHQYTSDIKKLHNIIQDVYKGFDLKPLVLAPGGFFNAKWFEVFVDGAGKNVEVVTHHIYNLGPGLDERLIDKILNPTYLDEGVQPFSGLDRILKKSNSSAVAWVGEAGGAYNSGRDLVTNAFVFSFWYLDQLGMAATYNTKTYCRQTLIGGNYGLLDKDSFLPNPDYYSALLWHRLMGKTVISTKFSGTKNIRAYSHCSRNSQGITLLLINLDGNTTVQVRVSTDNTTLPRQQDNQSEFAKTMKTREEYHLMAKNGNLHSKVMVLNGEALKVSSSGSIPSLKPIKVSVSDSIQVAPFSIVFAQIPSFNLAACN